ncbi:hypothetical protein GE09DRAFT_405331 [Coniochaeta sp. 2T2.1]|nr:hypothetical protein GE09DRAFT_405331 [Coniochaeta sp. 2T2.1]
MDQNRNTTTIKTEALQRNWVFDLVFRDYTWIEAAHNVENPLQRRPGVALVGYDLIQACHGSKNPSYLALIVNDWCGDVYYSLRDKLFPTFREQDFDFDEESTEVTFQSGLVLHVGDAIQVQEWVRLRDPSRLFGLNDKGVQTAVLYFEPVEGAKEALTIIDSDIGGVVNFSGKEYVTHMCSIPMHIGVGRTIPITRCFQAIKLQHKLVGFKKRGDKKYGSGFTLMDSWRLVEGYEREWSIVETPQ